MHTIYRDPLAQYFQQYDPDSPEARASAARALRAQREERAVLLAQMYQADLAVFDRMLAEFFRDDPAILTLLSAAMAARGMERRQQREAK
jgi:hypothetical protein